MHDGQGHEVTARRSPTATKSMTDVLAEMLSRKNQENEEGVSELWIGYALCTSSRSSLIPLITRCYAYARPALSVLPGDRYCPPWHNPARQATLPLPPV